MLATLNLAKLFEKKRYTYYACGILCGIWISGADALTACSNYAAIKNAEIKLAKIIKLRILIDWDDLDTCCKYL